MSTGVVVTAEDESRQPVEYTPYGNVLGRILYERGIRNPTAIARRIKAFGGYPRGISRQTVVNYLSGEHNVPHVFHVYAVAVAESERPLTASEVDELEYHYSWSQRQEDPAVTQENVNMAREYVRRALERRDQSQRGDGAGSPAD